MTLINIYSKYKFLFNMSAIGLTVVLISYGILQMLLINILTFIYLTYKTIKLLESSDTNDTTNSENSESSCSCDTDIKEKAKFATYISYLKRWVTYACYIMTETIFDILFKFLPFSFIYYISKIIVFIWIIQSDNNIDSIYKRWILDYYNSYKGRLEEMCEVIELIIFGCRSRLDNYISDSIHKVKNMVKSFIRELINENILNEIKDMPVTNYKELGVKSE